MCAHVRRKAAPFRAAALAAIAAFLAIMAIVVPVGSGARAEALPGPGASGGTPAAAASLPALRRAALWLGDVVAQGIADEDERRRDVRRVSGYDAPPAASGFDAADYGRYREALRADDPYAAPRSLIDLVPHNGEASVDRADGGSR
jgi:hypothetical protein